MITAVVYTSNTGHTKEYAELIGQQLNLPVCDLTEAKNKFEKSTEIIYLGWLMAGKLKGIKTANGVLTVYSCETD